MRIALQGEKRSYSDEAAQRHLGDLEILHRVSVEEALSSMEARIAEMPPSSPWKTPSLKPSRGHLLDTRLKLSGEITHRIRHCLITHLRTSIRAIR